MKNMMFVAVSQKMKEIAAQVNSEMDLDIPIVVSSMEKTEDIVKNNPQEQSQANQNIAHMLEELSDTGDKLIGMLRK